MQIVFARAGQVRLRHLEIWSFSFISELRTSRNTYTKRRHGWTWICEADRLSNCTSQPQRLRNSRDLKFNKSEIHWLWNRTTAKLYHLEFQQTSNATPLKFKQSEIQKLWTSSSPEVQPTKQSTPFIPEAGEGRASAGETPWFAEYLQFIRSADQQTLKIEWKLNNVIRLRVMESYIRRMFKQLWDGQHVKCNSS